MMKKKRGLLSIFLATFMIIAFSVPSFAATKQATYYGESSPVSLAVTPYVYEVCNGLPYHVMKSHCWGTAYVNGKTYVEGCAWQCTGCNYVMITEGDPLITGSVIGKWGGRAWSEKMNAVTYALVNATEYGVKNSAKMNGYKFVNA